MNTSKLIVTGYVISVSVPCRASYFFYKDTTFAEVEEHFTHLRDVYSKDHDVQVEMDRVRALLKYASCCGTTLKGIEKENRDLLVISFGFDSFDSMIEFRDSMEEAVEGATMK